MKEKDVLISGGAGFVGSALCKRLITLGANVTSVDNYSSGSKRNHHQGVVYVESDVRNFILDTERSFDLFYHLGEYSRVENSYDNIEKIRDYNVIPMFDICMYALRTGTKLIYAGSSTKFGDNGVARDESPYAWAKATNSELVRNFGKWFGLTFAITYFYNVYGPGEVDEGDYATVLGTFLSRKRQGLPLQVVLPGTQLRNFTYIDDTVDALILIGEKGEGDGYGIGADEAWSINDLAEAIGSDIDYMPERRGNRMSASVETSKTKRLGWKQTTRLQDYLDLNS